MFCLIIAWPLAIEYRSHTAHYRMGSAFRKLTGTLKTVPWLQFCAIEALPSPTKLRPHLQSSVSSAHADNQMAIIPSLGNSFT